jgi:ABC-2 type transport system permease protein
MRTLRAEWTKLRTVRSTVWNVAAVVALTVGLSALICSGTSTDATVSGNDDIVELSLSGAYLGQIAVVTLGVLAITSEFGTGTIRTTFAVMPMRRSVIGAKAVLVCVVALVAGLAGTVASFVLGQSQLRHNGFVEPAYPAATLTDSATFRAVVGTALFYTALALLSISVGGLLRHSASAISVLLGLLLLPLIVAQFLTVAVREAVLSTVPGAGLEVQSTVARADNLPIGPTGGLAVTFGWAMLAFVACLWVSRWRDV